MTETPTVQLRSVSKTYLLGEVKVAALKQVSLSIHPGRFAMILGPSGGGKTTLLNLIGALDFATGGQVFVLGQDVATLSDNDLSDFRAKNIAFIFQSFNLIPVLTAYENVEYPLVLLRVPERERRERTRETLAAVGLERHADHRPNQLSGGQRQRVAIARALVKRPSLVLADEPTANLDRATGAAIIELMHRAQASEGVTFIFSTHDPQLISHSEDTFQLQDGKLQKPRGVS